jgi:Ni,Fe-hydrogenase maturation factor
VSWTIPGVVVETNYQLTIEDAAEAVKFSRVLFLDAASSGPEPYALQRIEPASALAFTTHLVAPAAILGICEQCYGRRPEGWQLAIRGYEFELEEALTPSAAANLREALQFLRSWLTQR